MMGAICSGIAVREPKDVGEVYLFNLVIGNEPQLLFVSVAKERVSRLFWQSRALTTLQISTLKASFHTTVLSNLLLIAG